MLNSRAAAQAWTIWTGREPVGAKSGLESFGKMKMASASTLFLLWLASRFSMKMVSPFSRALIWPCRLNGCTFPRIDASSSPTFVSKFCTQFPVTRPLRFSLILIFANGMVEISTLSDLMRNAVESIIEM